MQIFYVYHQIKCYIRKLFAQTSLKTLSELIWHHLEVTKHCCRQRQKCRCTWFWIWWVTHALMISQWIHVHRNSPLIEMFCISRNHVSLQFWIVKFRSRSIPVFFHWKSQISLFPRTVKGEIAFTINSWKITTHH